jgi:hypothetical protein
MPNIHPLVDKLYKPYDIGQVGQLDLHILAEIFGGDQAARDLTPAWDGGIYWAGQRLDATAAEQASTKSLAMFYLSAWKNNASAQAFAKLYAEDLGRKYSGLKIDVAAQKSAPVASGVQEQVFSTNEGPVVITTRGKLVFVSESFDLDLARKLTQLVMDSQGTGALRMAGTHPGKEPSAPSSPAIGEPLTASLTRFLANCGIMKAAVDAEIKTAAAQR